MPKDLQCTQVNNTNREVGDRQVGGAKNRCVQDRKESVEPESGVIG